MPFSKHYRPAPRVLQLGAEFYDAVEAAWFPRQQLRFRNQRWAQALGLGELTDAEWTRHFCQFEALPENLVQPLALRYHGHQFDSYNPHLGDGRGFLFAQLEGPGRLAAAPALDGVATGAPPADRTVAAVTTAEASAVAAMSAANRAVAAAPAVAELRLLDLGTKGSGQTPYSRGGDGRLTLKGGVREVLATEMLEALGVTTSKSFSLYETGEALTRGDEPSPTRSSVLVRLNHSHVRIGTFQRLSYHDDVASLAKLVEYSAEHLLPAVRGHHSAPLALMHAVCRASAKLCAEWLVAGFVHGVLNSDNMTLTGESFDYGPYRFLPVYDPNFVAAYFDHSGLYAFGQQPRAVYKNLQRLAQCLVVLEPSAAWGNCLDAFVEVLRRERSAALLARLGLHAIEPDADETLAQACWDFLAKRHVGYDQFFHDWWGGPASAARAAASPAAAAYSHADFRPLEQLLRAREPRAPGRLEQPYFQQALPCSLLIDEIESLWAHIADHDAWERFVEKIEQIREFGRARHLD